MGVFQDILGEVTESVTSIISDGILGWISSIVVGLFDFLVRAFLSGFGPNIGNFLIWLTDTNDPNAARDGVGSLISNGWMSYVINSGGGSGFHGAADILGVFAVLGFSLAIIIFLFSMITSSANPFAETKDTPIKLVARFAVAILVINYSFTIANGMFWITQQAWDIIMGMEMDHSIVVPNLIDIITGAINDPSEAVEVGATAALTGVGFMMAPGITLVLLVLFVLIVMYEFLKFMLEIIERFMVTAILHISMPVVAATIVSTNTVKIFKSYISMMACQLFLLLMNAFFCRVFFVMITHMTPGLMSLFIIIAYLKAAQRIDSYMHSLGLNSATTGGGLLDSCMMAGRTMMALGAKAAGTPIGQKVTDSLGVGAKTHDNGVVIRARDKSALEVAMNPANQGKSMYDILQASDDFGLKTGSYLNKMSADDMMRDSSIADKYADGDALAKSAYNQMGDDARSEINRQRIEGNDNDGTGADIEAPNLNNAPVVPDDEEEDTPIKPDDNDEDNQDDGTHINAPGSPDTGNPDYDQDNDEDDDNDDTKPDDGEDDGNNGPHVGGGNGQDDYSNREHGFDNPSDDENDEKKDGKPGSPKPAPDSKGGKGGEGSSKKGTDSKTTEAPDTGDSSSKKAQVGAPDKASAQKPYGFNADTKTYNPATSPVPGSVGSGSSKSSGTHVSAGSSGSHASAGSSGSSKSSIRTSLGMQPGNKSQSVSWDPEARGGVYTGQAKYGSGEGMTIPIIASTSPVRNEIGTYKKGGETWHIGNNAQAGADGTPGFGIASIGSSPVSDMGYLQAKTGISQQMLEANNVNTSQIASASYDASAGALHFEDERGERLASVRNGSERGSGYQITSYRNSGAGVSEGVHETIGGASIVGIGGTYNDRAISLQNDIAQDEQRMASGAAGSFVSSGSLGEGHNNIHFDSAAERNQHEAKYSSSSASKLTETDLAACGGAYEKFGSNADSAAAFKYDLNHGMYGQTIMGTGKQAVEVRDLSGTHMNETNGARYPSGVYEVTFNDGSSTHYVLADANNGGMNLPSKGSRFTEAHRNATAMNAKTGDGEKTTSGPGAGLHRHLIAYEKPIFRTQRSSSRDADRKSGGKDEDKKKNRKDGEKK